MKVAQFRKSTADSNDNDGAVASLLIQMEWMYEMGISRGFLVLLLLLDPVSDIASVFLLLCVQMALANFAGGGTSHSSPLSLFLSHSTLRFA